MTIKLTNEDVKFIKDNWIIMQNKDIAKSIGVSVNYISMRAREMGLPDKRKPITDADMEQLRAYKDSIEAEIEKEGRVRNKQLQYIRDQIEKNNSLKIRIKEERGSRFLSGPIVQKTDELVVLKTGEYKESFRYVDFYTGRAVIV